MSSDQSHTPEITVIFPDNPEEDFESEYLEEKRPAKIIYCQWLQSS